MPFIDFQFASSKVHKKILYVSKLRSKIFDYSLRQCM